MSIQTPAVPLSSQCPTVQQKAAAHGRSIWAPAAQVEDHEEISDSWLWTDPTAIVAFVGENTEDISLLFHL